MSTHSVDVIKIEEILPHPNADRLELVKIGEYICCSQRGNFKVGDLAVYIEPDYCVPTDRPEFAFLAQDGRNVARIKVKRLRGVMSQGLLIPPPDGVNEGDNVMEQLGITRYVPQMVNYPRSPRNGGSATRADQETPPEGEYPKYDLENWKRYSRLLNDGEKVQVTEKIHGSNAKYTFKDGKMHLGSRSRWVKDDGHNPWSLALAQNPWIAEFCEANPEWTVYGEIYGWIQDLKYGHEQGEISFLAFDILFENRWLDRSETESVFVPANATETWNSQKQILSVPVLYEGPYDRDTVLAHVDGQSTLYNAAHLREGIVVKPWEERNDIRLGRVALKIVSDNYLERS